MTHRSTGRHDTSGRARCAMETHRRFITRRPWRNTSPLRTRTLHKRSGRSITAQGSFQALPRPPWPFHGDNVIETNVLPLDRDQGNFCSPTAPSTRLACHNPLDPSTIPLRPTVRQLDARRFVENGSRDRFFVPLTCCRLCGLHFITFDRQFRLDNMDTRTQEQRRRIMQAVKGKNTGPELTVRRLLHGMGYRFRLHRKDLPGRPDIVLPKYRKAIYVHGCFWHWHGCPKGQLPKSRLDYWRPKLEANVKRDRTKTEQIESLGWTTLIIWQCEIQDTDTLAARLQEFVEG